MIIDYSRDTLLTDFAKETLKKKYMVPGEKSPQEAFARAAKAFADDDDHAQRIYDYASKLWMMYASPILSNGGTERGLSISCFLSYVDDSIEGLTEHYKENAFLSSSGGGIGSYWGAVRSDGTATSKGSMSTGTIPFLKMAESGKMAFHQGHNRKGAYVAYQDVSHCEIKEFIDIRKETGDLNRRAGKLNNAVNLTDEFMEAVENGKEWKLRDPHTFEVKEVVSARELWQHILETRAGDGKGEPYLHFIDEANRCLPESQKKQGLQIFGSNLCNEIELATSPDRTAVCCLSSVNVEKYDEWKDDPLFIEDMVRFLDNVLSDFIKKAPDQLWRAKNSASLERSIGLGQMGFHSYLQKNGIPFEGPIAMGINLKVAKHIHEQAKAATIKLAKERGECPDAMGSGVRNIHLIAIAPNATSSVICGETSPSIEPHTANAFIRKTNIGYSLVKNKFLEELLESKGQNTDEVWTSIIGSEGSVQHLEFLTDWEKSVFKTAIELDQMWIIEHAAARKPFVCQSQSVNLFMRPDVDRAYLHKVHFAAWKKKLKGLYYLRSVAASRPEVVSNKVKEESSECFACEG